MEKNWLHINEMDDTEDGSECGTGEAREGRLTRGVEDGVHGAIVPAVVRQRAEHQEPRS